MSSGSAAYKLSDDEIAIENKETGRRYPLWGRALSLYRALSYARGHAVSQADLLDIVWGGFAVKANVTQQVSRLRRMIAPDVIETIDRFGYIVK